MWYLNKKLRTSWEVRTFTNLIEVLNWVTLNVGIRSDRKYEIRKMLYLNRRGGKKGDWLRKYFNLIRVFGIMNIELRNWNCDNGREQCAEYLILFFWCEDNRLIVWCPQPCEEILSLQTMKQKVGGGDGNGAESGAKILWGRWSGKLGSQSYSFKKEFFTHHISI